MRIDRHFYPPIPSGAGKPRPVAAVEPVNAISRESYRATESGFRSARVQTDWPLDRHVRLALEAYLSYQQGLEEPVTLLHGVDVYV